MTSLLTCKASIKSKFQLPKKLTIGNILIVLIIAYFLIGIFPFGIIENDGIRISIGIQSGKLYNDYEISYLYATHSGTYHVSKVLQSIINLPAFELLSILTGISMIVFIISSSLFVKRITKVSFLLSFISIILFQESTISGYYPNSSMPAAAALAIALLLVTGNHVAIFFSGIFYALAFWIRFDAIFIGLAFLIILVFINKKGFWMVIVFGLTSAITGILLFTLSNLSFQSMVDSYYYYLELINNVSNIRLTLEMYAIHFTLAVVLLFGVGIFLFVKSKNWRFLSLSLISPIPVMAAYGMHPTSSKHLLYLVLFLAIPISYSINFLIRTKNHKYKIILFIAIVSFFGQYIFSPPFSMLNFLNSESICHNCSGIYMRTADADRLRGNILYAPLYFNKIKTHAIANDDFYLQGFLTYLSEHNPAYIVSYEWKANEWILYHLQDNGYLITQFDMRDFGIRIKLQKEGKEVTLIRINPIQSGDPLNLPGSVKNDIDELNSVLFINISPENTNNNFLTQYFTWSVLDNMHLFYTVELTAK